MQPKHYVKTASHDTALTRWEIDKIEASLAMGKQHLLGILIDTDLHHKVYAVGAYLRMDREQILEVTGSLMSCKVETYLSIEGHTASIALVNNIHNILGPSHFKNVYKYEDIRYACSKAMSLCKYRLTETETETGDEFTMPFC